MSMYNNQNASYPLKPLHDNTKQLYKEIMDDLIKEVRDYFYNCDLQDDVLETLRNTE